MKSTNCQNAPAAFSRFTHKIHHLYSTQATKNEREVLKCFLLGNLYLLFREIIKPSANDTKTCISMEYYNMDSKIIQHLIKDIVESGEYTLEGIAYHTHIPFDVIYEVASGINNQFTITLWAKIVELYMQVKPDVSTALIDKLIELNEKNRTSLSILLNED